MGINFIIQIYHIKELVSTKNQEKIRFLRSTKLKQLSRPMRPLHTDSCY